MSIFLLILVVVFWRYFSHWSLNRPQTHLTIDLETSLAIDLDSIAKSVVRDTKKFWLLRLLLNSKFLVLIRQFILILISQNKSKIQS